MLYELVTQANGSKDIQEVELSSLGAAGWKEKDLENLLVGRISMILREEQLMVISQERAGQEAPDILAVDASGETYIFEIKRYGGKQENLLQVIRYGQLFGGHRYDDLNRLFQLHLRTPAELAERHATYFELEDALPHSAFNQKQHFIVVVAGIDRETLDAIRYWKQLGLPISASTYHVYEIGGKHYIDFHAFAPDEDDYAALLTDCYIVNTDYAFNPQDYVSMLTEDKAAAYNERKKAVDRIQKGARVYLYHSGVGIIAAGKALSGVKVGPTPEEPVDGEHYIPLQLFFKADPFTERDKCIPASAIRAAVEMTITYRQTAFTIPKKVADAIDQLIKAKTQSSATTTTP